MKKPIATLAALAALAPALAPAAENHGVPGGHGAMHAGAAQSALVDGLVKKIDKAGGKLSIAHGALPNGMPAMTMAYKVKDPAWLDQLKSGQKIRFAFDERNGVFTVVRLEMLK